MNNSDVFICCASIFSVRSIHLLSFFSPAVHWGESCHFFLIGQQKNMNFLVTIDDTITCVRLKIERRCKKTRELNDELVNKNIFCQITNY